MTEAMVSLSEAARRSGMATTTIRRWIETGKLDGTLRTATGGYSIPVTALIGQLPAGTWDKVSDPAPVEAPAKASTETAVVLTDPILAEQLRHAQEQIADLKARLDYAETRRIVETEQAARASRELVEQLTEVVAKLTNALPAAQEQATPKKRWLRRTKS